MQIKALPENINPETLNNLAITLQQSAHAQESAALQRIGHYFGDPAKINLQTAQLVVAHEFGFSGWSKLEHHLEHKTSDDALLIDRLVSQFLDLVVVQYSPAKDQGPARFAQARELLDNHPEILNENIYAAAAIGDINELDRWLDSSPGLARQKGGFHHWEPLMYASYARLPGSSSLGTALRLLERGADPNAFYMWNGQYKFTALTGAFGHGEGGTVNQPEHPDYQPLCRALLQQGANANDSQAAYNRGLGSDNKCLEMLIEFGLNAQDKNNWLISDEDQWLPNPSETMHYQLIQAIRRGYVERAKLLIDNGVDIHKPDDTYETRTKGKTPLETALVTGEQEIADYLRANGADDSEVSALTLLQAACCSADSASANSLIQTEPGLRERLQPYAREMLCEAVSKGNQTALELMIELNFELNDNSGRPPLHEAALTGNLDLVKLLIKAGADPTLRDPDYMGVPIGFAQHNGRDHVVNYLDTLEMDIFTAAARGNLDQLQLLLNHDSSLLDITFASIRPTSKKESSELDWMTPLVFAARNSRVDAVKYLLAQGANPAVSNGGELDLTSLLEQTGGSVEIIELIAALDRH